MAGIIKNSQVYATKVDIDDTIISSGKTWSSEKISKINVSDAKKVDSKPTYSNGTITYVKDGTSYTTTNSKQWFYYLENGSLKQTIFIDGEELTIDGASVDFSEYIKKTSIATTLDSSCTNEQVAGAKDVVDNIKYKYLPTLHNVDVLDYIVNNINKEGFYTFYVADDCTNTPRGNWTRMFVDYLSKTRIIVTGVDIRSFNNTCEYKNTMINTWSGWKRVCTTSVADVPVKNISLSTKTSKLNGVLYYCVKNGVCTVDLDNLSFNATGMNFVEIDGVLPAPILPIRASLINHSDNSMVGHCYMSTNNTKLGFHALKANSPGYITFSYPVVES